MIFNLHCVRSAMFIDSSGGTVHMFLSLITSILFFFCVCVCSFPLQYYKRITFILLGTVNRFDSLKQSLYEQITFIICLITVILFSNVE